MATQATKAEKEQVMDKILIDAAGNELPNKSEEKATGIRIVRDSHKVDLQTGSPAGHPVTMAAVFGLGTKATNIASTVRQANGKKPDAENEILAVSEWFDMLYGENKWNDDTPRVGGLRVNRDRAAQAAVEALIESGETFPDQAAKVAELRQLFNDDDTVKAYLAIPEVDEAYQRLTPRKAKETDKSLADLAALLKK